MIGSADTLTGPPTVEKEVFFGKASGTEPSAEHALHPFVARGGQTIMTRETVVPGHAAV